MIRRNALHRYQFLGQLKAATMLSKAEHCSLNFTTHGYVTLFHCHSSFYGTSHASRESFFRYWHHLFCYHGGGRKRKRTWVLQVNRFTFWFVSPGSTLLVRQSDPVPQSKGQWLVRLGSTVKVHSLLGIFFYLLGVKVRQNFFILWYRFHFYKNLKN